MHRLFLLPREHILDKYPVASRGAIAKRLFDFLFQFSKRISVKKLNYSDSEAVAEHF